MRPADSQLPEKLAAPAKATGEDPLGKVLPLSVHTQCIMLVIDSFRTLLLLAFYYVLYVNCECRRNLLWFSCVWHCCGGTLAGVQVHFASDKQIKIP